MAALLERFIVVLSVVRTGQGGRHLYVETMVFMKPGERDDAGEAQLTLLSMKGHFQVEVPRRPIL